jgi:hypothetical protein
MRKHLPLDQWPSADIEAFALVYKPGDPSTRPQGLGLTWQRERAG